MESHQVWDGPHDRGVRRQSWVAPHTAIQSWHKDALSTQAKGTIIIAEEIHTQVIGRLSDTFHGKSNLGSLEVIEKLRIMHCNDEIINIDNNILPCRP